jgi:UDP:flavonoid glycosyltransferase YjiC (YdhE family)
MAIALSATVPPPFPRGEGVCLASLMRILFTSSPGWGHVHPMVPLALAFLKRGDEVLWATGADSAVRLGGEGIAAAPAGLGEREAMAEFSRRFPEVADLPPPARSDFMFPRLFGTIRTASMLTDLEPVAQEWRPDLIVSDVAEFAGHIVAASLGVASVSHAFGGLLPEPRVAAAGEAVASLWTEHRLEPRPYGGMYDHLYIDIYPPGLQPSERDHVPATQLLRPGAFATAGEEVLPDWVTESTGDPLIYVTFGTVFSNDAALAAVIEGVRGLDVRVAVTVGPHGDPDSLGAQSENVHVARYIPQGRLLPHCAAVVSHCGSGTFLAALAAQVPQLCIPQGADQFFNAGACADSGSGLALQRDEVNALAVRDAVMRLLSDTAFGNAAERISLEIDAMPTPHEVADILHQRFR